MSLFEYLQRQSGPGQISDAVRRGVLEGVVRDLLKTNIEEGIRLLPPFISTTAIWAQIDGGKCIWVYDTLTLEEEKQKCACSDKLGVFRRLVDLCIHMRGWPGNRINRKDYMEWRSAMDAFVAPGTVHEFKKIDDLMTEASGMSFGSDALVNARVGRKQAIRAALSAFMSGNSAAFVQAGLSIVASD
jgi:hypothetical protein